MMNHSVSSRVICMLFLPGASLQKCIRQLESFGVSVDLGLPAFTDEGVQRDFTLWGTQQQLLAARESLGEPDAYGIYRIAR